LSITASACCTSFSMRMNYLWAAFAVPVVFDRVCDASGAFNAASRAAAALVFGVVVGVAVHGCCLLIVCGFQRCAVWLFATDILEVVLGALLYRVLCVISICSVSCTLGSVALGCALETVASSFWMGTLRSDLGTNVASISSVRWRIFCSYFAVTNGLLFRTLARLDIAFMILLACDNDGLVMFSCLKWTVLDNLSFWVDLIWQECV